GKRQPRGESKTGQSAPRVGASPGGVKTGQSAPRLGRGRSRSTSGRCGDRLGGRGDRGHSRCILGEDVAASLRRRGGSLPRPGPPLALLCSREQRWPTVDKGGKITLLRAQRGRYNRIKRMEDTFVPWPVLKRP